MRKIINVSVHPLIFRGSAVRTDEYVVEGRFAEIMEPEFVPIRFREETKTGKNGITIVRQIFEPTPEGDRLLKSIETEHPDAIIVGTEEQARVYPGRIYVPVPAYNSRPETEDGGIIRYDDRIFRSF